MIQDKAAKRVEAAGIKARKKLDEAADAVHAFYKAARDAGYMEGALDRGRADSRLLLIEQIQEYSRYLAGRFEK